MRCIDFGKSRPGPAGIGVPPELGAAGEPAGARLGGAAPPPCRPPPRPPAPVLAAAGARPHPPPRAAAGPPPPTPPRQAAAARQTQQVRALHRRPQPRLLQAAPADQEGGG